MDDIADSCVPPDMDENITQLPISPEKPAVASPYAIPSSVSEAAKNDDEEFKTVHQSHGEVLETSWKLISCGNRSSENASTVQEVSRFQTCNRATTLQGDKNDADCTRSNNRCGMHEDMLFDILLWLPVASLLRFRSVCRLWCSLIDSSNFITQHYNHNSGKSCLLTHHALSSYVDGYGSKFCLLSGNKYELYSSMDYEQPWYSVDEIIILNSCDGIVSLSKKKSGNVALWNPATKQLRPLPESSISHPCLSVCTGISGGFGFDVKNNDYKFVKILYRYKNKHINLVEIYNPRTDSWRVIHKDDVLPFRYIDRNAAICKNGRCFWTGFAHRDEYSPILVSFDLNNEVFETMPLPGERDQEQHDRSHAYNALDLLNDKLCYIKGVNLSPFDMGRAYFEIWMLDEYGVKESWEKICKFVPTGSKWDPPYVLGISKNGQVRLLGYNLSNFDECGNGELYLSNFDAREEEYLEHGNLKLVASKFFYNKLQYPNPIILEFVRYKASLVSLKREDGRV